jgi:hypothetical protein
MSDHGERSVGATPISGHVRPSRTFKPGRRCRHEGCGTILSIYNEDAYCYLHAPMVTPRTRGRKIA